MKTNQIQGLILCAALFASGCQTVTLRPEGGIRDTSPAAFEERQSFFFWGLGGTSKVNVKKACSGGEATQMQTQFTFLDGFLGVITLGIYSPRSAKVWCKKGKGDKA